MREGASVGPAGTVALGKGVAVVKAGQGVNVRLLVTVSEGVTAMVAAGTGPVGSIWQALMASMKKIASGIENFRVPIGCIESQAQTACSLLFC
jgi:hypothetical protein